MPRSERTDRRLAGRLARVLSGAMIAAALTACAATPATSHAQRDNAGANRPNVIVIIADDLGYNDIGANGGRIPTPHIDALAASGARMTAGYVTAAVCAPSRAGLLAGRQQTRFGFEFNPVGRDETGGMSLNETTIAQTMRSAGYRTGMVGKWHIGQAPGYQPLDRGFDSFFGILGGATPYLSTIGDKDLHVVTAEDAVITRQRLPVYDGRTPVQTDEYVTDLFTDRALAFIGRQTDQPFFLYLSYTAPHTPLQASARYLDRVTGTPANEYDRVYQAMMIALDDGVGRLVAHLKATGQYENTLIFFLSDNGCPSYIGGACSNAPLNAWKGYPWDGGIRVPYLVSWPGRISPGVTDTPVSSLDIAATAAAAAGVAHPGAEGIDLVPALQGKNENTRALFWRMGPTHVVRSGAWKLILVNRSSAAAGGDELGRSRRPDGVPATISPLGQATFLYDVVADPGETTNLATRHPDVVAQLQQEWANWNARNVEPQWTSRRGVNAQIAGERVELFN